MGNLGTAKASPTKQFFVFMITKDISLEDSILDLLDNCIDGARKVLLSRAGAVPRVASYEGYVAKLEFSDQLFRISDNCGGISLDDAINYAFHFGRRPDAPHDADGFSIGVYGIGMKRAVFRLGTNIEIHSSTATESFVAKIDVPTWLKKAADDWDFDLDNAPKIEGTGTSIVVRGLNENVATELGASAFQNEMRRIIARDYAQFLARGFKIFVNGDPIIGYQYLLKEDAEFKPVKIEYVDDDIQVEIFAGMAGSPPDDSSPSNRHTDTNYFGWYVFCNDRVVLAANKSNATVWGNGDFPEWHSQYNGFMGILVFHSIQASKLPWTTTKRAIDVDAPVYRRAVARMKEVTRAWIDYTYARQSDLDSAKKQEAAARSISAFSVAVNPTLVTPAQFRTQTNRTVTVSFKRSEADVRRAAKASGNINRSNSATGSFAFEYFLKHEAGSEE